MLELRQLRRCPIPRWRSLPVWLSRQCGTYRHSDNWWLIIFRTEALVEKTKVDFQPHQEGHDCRMHGVTVRWPGGKKLGWEGTVGMGLGCAQSQMTGQKPEWTFVGWASIVQAMSMYFLREKPSEIAFPMALNSGVGQLAVLHVLLYWSRNLTKVKHIRSSYT